MCLTDSPTMPSSNTLMSLKSRTNLDRSLGRGESTAIQKVRLVGEDGTPTTTFTSGEPLRLDVVFSTDGGAGLFAGNHNRWG